MTDPDVRRRLILGLRRMNTELARSNRVVAAATGLNERDLAVLDILNQEGPQSPSALARRTALHPATMTSVLARLVKGGWVERRRSESDLRAVAIHASGVHRLTGVFDPADTQLAAVLEGWPPDHVEAVLTFLEQVPDVIHDETDRLQRSTDS